jgi:DNA repair exonuclease SbcCD ATPase subunit
MDIARLEAEIRSLKAELEKTRQELAEVVDECVYVENQKQTAEARLAELSSVTASASGQQRLDADLLFCVEALGVYASTLEQEVLLPGIGVVSKTIAQFHESAYAREELLKELDALLSKYPQTPQLAKVFALMQPPVHADNVALIKRQKLLNGAPPISIDHAYAMVISLLANFEKLRALTLETVAHIAEKNESIAKKHCVDEKKVISTYKNTIRLLEDAAKIQPHGNEMLHVMQRLQELEQLQVQQEQERLLVAKNFETIQRALEEAQQNAKPNEEFVLLQMQNRHQSKTIESQQEEIVALRKELREAKKEHEQSVTELKRELDEQIKLKSSSEIDDFIRDLQRRSVQSGETVDVQEITKKYQNKVKAFELTITALNSELAVLEDKVLAMERRAEEDAEASRHQLAAERRKHRDEMDECEGVISRMTAELEHLLEENKSLRAKIRAAPIKTRH